LKSCLSLNEIGPVVLYGGDQKTLLVIAVGQALFNEVRILEREIIRETQSLCPVCLKRIDAWHIREGSDVFMEKTCSEHGSFKTIVWRGDDVFPMASWTGNIKQLGKSTEISCPERCGICEEHQQETCCVLLEVTRRCNLNCTYCFAGELAGEEPFASMIKKQIYEIASHGNTFLHFSGGEPTLRDDLPDLTAYARNLGFQYLQLNTNGIRLADDEGYVKALAAAGLSFVFLQFDGTADEIYTRLRGRPLWEVKRRAIENCARENLGVALVSTLVPGVNDGDIGNMISFGVSLSPAVRGIHFQPVSYFGRYPQNPSDDARFTLPELLNSIECQTHGKVLADYFSPSACDHPQCGFHGDFVVMPDGLRPLSQKRGERKPCCCKSDISASERNRRFVGRRWKRSASCCDDTPPDLESLEGFFDRVNSHGFTITAMAFQDCFNIDLERLRKCSMHVYSNGKIIPLCAKYLTVRMA
jgi:uncharacterized radical SAM superfamily Fe-S cluster-containing enzyme